MKLDPLLRSHEPWLHVLLASESDACNALWALERSSEGRAVCRVVRGHKATTEPAFFDECAAAWQFPYYFGENWDAFEECLTDLEWLPAEAYVFCVTQGSPSPGKRAERTTASVAIGVTTDSKGMGPVNPEPSGESVPCPSAMHSRGEAVTGPAPASSRSASRRRLVTEKLSRAIRNKLPRWNKFSPGGTG